MSKPFNFEEFKAGKPAKLGSVKIVFYDFFSEINHPIVCKLLYPNGDVVVCSYTETFLNKNATMLPTKRTVWIAIIKTNRGNIAPIGVFYETKEEAIKICGQNWIVIDAIPYEIEE